MASCATGEQRAKKPAVNFTAAECVGVMDAIDAYIVSGPAQGDTPDMLKDALQKVRDALQPIPFANGVRCQLLSGRGATWPCTTPTRCRGEVRVMRKRSPGTSAIDL